MRRVGEMGWRWHGVSPLCLRPLSITQQPALSPPHSRSLLPCTPSAVVEVIKSLGKNLLTGAACCCCWGAWGVGGMRGVGVTRGAGLATRVPPCAAPPACTRACIHSCLLRAPPPPPSLPHTPGNLDLLKVSLPVVLFEPRSYLQKLADPWVRCAALRRAVLRCCVCVYWSWAGGAVCCCCCCCCATPVIAAASACRPPPPPPPPGLPPLPQGSSRDRGSGAAAAVGGGFLHCRCGRAAAGGGRRAKRSCRQPSACPPTTLPLACRPPARPTPAGFHRAFVHWAKPFNPILGETWQAAGPDGSHIALEQISHHPPVSAFQLEGPHGAYTFCGQSQPSVSYKTNAVKVGGGRAPCRGRWQQGPVPLPAAPPPPSAAPSPPPLPLPILPDHGARLPRC